MREATMASIDEVWGKDFGKTPTKPLSSKAYVSEKRDPVKEGRVAATPQERSTEAIQRNRKTIDDLSKSLPIVQSDEEGGKNYHGHRQTPMASSAAPIQEGFTPQYAYAPPGYQSDNKLSYLLAKLEESKASSESNATQDMMLYIFTGIFFLFTLDTFVNMGKKMRRR
jgi:hypothetical protein